MSEFRTRMYRIHRKLQAVILPGLRSSQYAYYETIQELVRHHPVWLDLGCGHHVFGNWMGSEQQEVASQARTLVGLDYDLPSVRKHQVVRDRLVGDIARLPFGDRSFDLITANMVVEHLADPLVSLAEIRRVLKPGGRFVFHTPNYQNYLIFLASLTPEFLKIPLTRFLEQRSPEDIFPTWYRLNTPGTAREQAARSGFELRKLHLVSSVAVTACLGPLSLFELLLLRLLAIPRFANFRSDMIAVLEKPCGDAGSDLEPALAGAVHTSHPQATA